MKGGGGINPDILVDANSLPPYVQGLWREGVFLTFAATYVPMHSIKNPFSITDKVLNDFKSFLEEYEIEYNNTKRKIKAYAIVFANTSQYGNDARIAPNAIQVSIQ